jgi:hypothetical protein
VATQNRFQLTGELAGDVDDDVLVDVGRALSRVVAQRPEFADASTSRVDASTIAVTVAILTTSFTSAETLGQDLMQLVIHDAGIADDTNLVGPRHPDHPSRRVETAGTELVLV